MVSLASNIFSFLYNNEDSDMNELKKYHIENIFNFEEKFIFDNVYEFKINDSEIEKLKQPEMINKYKYLLVDVYVNEYIYYESPIKELEKNYRVYLSLWFNPILKKIGSLPKNILKLELAGTPYKLEDSILYLICRSPYGSGHEYSHMYTPNIKYLPQNLLYLNLGPHFNNDIKGLPKNLEYLSFTTCGSFDKKIKEGDLPQNLKYLELPSNYQYKIDEICLPKSILKVKIGKEIFNFNEYLLL